MSRFKRAFTLIELLVVVAIIALLISILLPSLKGAKAQARRVVCATNLRTMYQSMFSYSDDNQEFMVGGIMRVTTSTSNQEWGNWATALLPYLGYYDGDLVERQRLWRQNRQRDLAKVFLDQPILQCPDNPDPEQPLDYVASATSMPYSFEAVQQDTRGGGQAGEDFEVVWGAENSSYRPFFKLESIPDPARFVYFTENHVSLYVPVRTGDGKSFAFHTFFFASQLPFGAYPRIANDIRHPGGLVMGFYDGHAEPHLPSWLDEGWPRSLGQRLINVAPTDPEYY
ncbi:MAG: DUF1559 domain-containing protein [Phycisphaerales bacterium]|nr:DUF1559 domain-containing protein [Phycisphaerales bacterium]